MEYLKENDVGIYYRHNVHQYYKPKCQGVITNIMEVKIPTWYLAAYEWLTDNTKNILVLRGYTCQISEECYKRFFRYYELSYIDHGKQVRVTCKNGKHSDRQFSEYDAKIILFVDVDLKD